jgi:pseudouridine synthase
MEIERIQKILARAGYGSRRACETIIKEGRVAVDGTTAQLGDKADATTQRISVDGVSISKPQDYVYILLHKPRGYITTTSDPQGRHTVMELITRSPNMNTKPPRVRLYPVGRLDADSEGLLLLTNDGVLTQKLTHPRYQHPRVYRVQLREMPDKKTIERWQQGLTLDGKLTRFSSVMLDGQSRGKTWIRVTVHEGRKHLVRRMVAALGHPALRLIRIQMGPLELRNLPSGQWRYLSKGEVHALRAIQDKSQQGKRKRHPNATHRLSQHKRSENRSQSR